MFYISDDWKKWYETFYNRSSLRITNSESDNYD